MRFCTYCGSLSPSERIQKAALKGHYACLLTALHNKEPMTNDACTNAASAGYLNCLILLRDNKCPWDFRTLQMSWLLGFKICFAWAHAHGCVCNGFVLEYDPLTTERILVKCPVCFCS